MSGLCRCRACFAARAAERAAARETKHAERERRRALWPGRHFQLDALPPYLELSRTPRGWEMQRYQPSRAGR